MSITRFKIKFNNICKYIPIQESLEDLLSLIKNTFDFNEDDLFSLSYKDEEDDSIIISDSMDYSNLITYMNIQNKKSITIQISSQKNNKKTSQLNNQDNKNDLFGNLNKKYNNINNVISSLQKDLSSNYLNKTLNFNTKNNNDSLIVNLTLINNGKLEWPNPSKRKISNFW